MRKILFGLTLLSVFALTACGNKPYESDLEGFTFIESNEITFDFNDGNGSVELFHFSFDEELKMFVNEEGDVYNFKNINDYLVASAQMEKLIDAFEGNVQFNTTVELGFDDTIELSTGATEDKYNYIDVEIGEEAYIEDAFIVADNGVTIMLSYTRFIVDGEDLYVPSYIQLFASTIHQEISWEFLPEDNEYSEDKMKQIEYELYIVPLPNKTGVYSTYEAILETGTEVDDFTLVVPNDTDDTGTWTACEIDQVDNCISPTSTILEIQVHDQDEESVYLFYEENFGALMDDNEFTFSNLNQSFVIYDVEEVQVLNELDEVVTVVNAKIRLK